MERFGTPYIYIILFLLFSHAGYSQILELTLNFKTAEGERIELEFPYTRNHSSLDSLTEQAKRIVKNLEKKGYLNAKLDSLTRKSNHYTGHYMLGTKCERVEVSLQTNSVYLLLEREIKELGFKIKNNTLMIPFEQLESALQKLASILENKGNSFATVQLNHIKLINSVATADLQITMSGFRKIDKIVVKGYENFPQHFLKHALQLKIGTVFNQDKLERASLAVGQLNFAQETKSPEVLFTADSTIIYLYLRKKRSNKFDGILGFASKEQEDGIELNGYLDLQLNNIFNGGESIAVFWKNNGNDRQRFYLQTEIPYLFGLPLIPKINFELYRQDSTFSNTRALIDLKYRVQNIGDLGLFGSFEKSTDLLKIPSENTQAYNNQFYGLSYALNKPMADEIFRTKYNIMVRAMIGNRTSEETKTGQSKFVMNLNYLIDFDQKHFVFLQNFSGILLSDDFFDNELFRIGGINNLRGFNEEQIITPAYSVFNLEYRYKSNAQSYFYTITDLGLIDNHIEESLENVFSLGLGYSFRTKAGILNLSYALGKFSDQPFAFDNSKIHIKIISIF